jgi:hypothetical protein
MLRILVRQRVRLPFPPLLELNQRPHFGWQPRNIQRDVSFQIVQDLFSSEEEVNQLS